MSSGSRAGPRGCLGCLGLVILLPALALLLGHRALALAVLLGLLFVVSHSGRRPARSLALAHAPGPRRGGRPRVRPVHPERTTLRRVRARGPIPARLRFRVLERDGFRCRYCGKSGRDEGVVLHADHVVPVVAGGETTERNLVTACETCNLGKGAGSTRPTR